MSFLTSVFLTFNYGGTTTMIPQSWCTEVLQHGALAQDISGNLYVMDSKELRRFTDHHLKKWYSTGATPVCILKSASSYPQGNDIKFRPDQDLEVPMALRIRGSKSKKLFLWYRGQVHELQISVKDLKLQDQRIFTISRLTLESLPKGETITNKTIMEGTVIIYKSKTFIYTRKGLRKVDKAFLTRLNISPYGPLNINTEQFKKLRLGTPLTFSATYVMPNNILIRGTHPQRIYLLLNGKRHYLWSHQAILRRGLDKKAIKQLSDDELYLIPYAGNLY